MGTMIMGSLADLQQHGHQQHGYRWMEASPRKQAAAYAIQPPFVAGGAPIPPRFAALYENAAPHADHVHPAQRHLGEVPQANSRRLSLEEAFQRQLSTSDCSEPSCFGGNRGGNHHHCPPAADGMLHRQHYAGHHALAEDLSRVHQSDQADNAASHQVYSRRHNQAQHVAGSEDDLESDYFRMFCFKVKMCQEARCHDWAQCLYAHPGEKASRRDPRLYRYSATPCPDVKRSGKCSRGDACSMAHGVFECWLHPARYRTQPCKDGDQCPRKVCFFAHTPEQLRLAPAAAAAAAVDAAAAAAAAANASNAAYNTGIDVQRRHSLDSALRGYEVPMGKLNQDLAHSQSFSTSSFPEHSPVKGPGSNLESLFRKPPSPACVLSPISSSPPPSPTLHGGASPCYGIHSPRSMSAQEATMGSPVRDQHNNVVYMNNGSMAAAHGLYHASSLPVLRHRGTNLLTSADCFAPSIRGPAAQFQRQQPMGSDVQHVAPPYSGPEAQTSRMGTWQQNSAAALSHGATFSRPASSAEAEPDLRWVHELIQD